MQRTTTYCIVSSKHVTKEHANTCEKMCVLCRSGEGDKQLKPQAHQEVYEDAIASTGQSSSNMLRTTLDPMDQSPRNMQMRVM